MQQRRKQKVKKRKAKRKLKKLIFLFVFIVLCFFIVSKVGLFRIKSIDIKGNSQIKTQEIIKATGLNQGQNYNFTEKNKIILNLKRLPFVKDANIKFSLKGNLKIFIVERRPIGEIKGSTNYIVDDELRILKTSDNFNDKLIDIEGIDTNKYEIGAFVFRNDENLRDVSLKILNSKYKDEIKKITYEKETLNFTLKNDVEVIFGGDEKYDYKMKLLDKVFKDVEETGKNIVSVDLVSGDDVIVVLQDDTNYENNWDNYIEND